MPTQKVAASSAVKVKCASFGCKRMMLASKATIIGGENYTSCGKCQSTCDVCIETKGLKTRKGVTLCKSCIQRNVGLIRETRRLVGAGK
jgi:hypothetical protein